MTMRHTAIMGAIGTGPAILVDQIRSLHNLPIKDQMDLYLRWGMYCFAMAASLCTIISAYRRWKKGKL